MQREQQQREKFSRINSSLILFWLLLLFQKMVRSESFGSTAPKTFTSSPGYWLVVDFDGTCTARDTTPLLPVLASFLSDDNDSQRDERLANFKSLEQEYFGLLQQSKSKLSSLLSSSSSTDEITLERALDTLDEASILVTNKVSSSGVLKGLDVPAHKLHSLIEEQASVREHVRLLPDCLSVLSSIYRSIAVQKEDNRIQWKLGVLSINWCPSLIEATLLQPLEEYFSSTKTTATATAMTTTIPIWSNAVDSNGVVHLNVSGAIAKQTQIVKLQRQQQVIYVGDSSTDLAALVQADVGILIGTSQSTRDMCKQFKIPMIPITDYPQRDDSDENNDNNNNGPYKQTVWTAQNWNEIGNFLATIR